MYSRPGVPGPGTFCFLDTRSTQTCWYYFHLCSTHRVQQRTNRDQYSLLVLLGWQCTPPTNTIDTFLTSVREFFKESQVTQENDTYISTYVCAARAECFSRSERYSLIVLFSWLCAGNPQRRVSTSLVQLSNFLPNTCTVVAALQLATTNYTQAL